MNALSEQDKTAARARQQKRYRDDAAQKQYAEREHIRGEIPTRKLVTDLLQISEVMHQGYEDIMTPAGELMRMELDSTRQQGLSKSAEIKFKLLNKTVPDLKQIELRADVTEEALPQAIEIVIVKPEVSYDD